MTQAVYRALRSPWLFAGPALAAAICFVWLPMVSTLGLSFFDWSLLRQEATWRGLDHYRETLANPDFRLAFTNTALYLAVKLPRVGLSGQSESVARNTSSGGAKAVRIIQAIGKSVARHTAMKAM
jgi:ABC-type sugar transport system permease subunit